MKAQSRIPLVPSESTIAHERRESGRSDAEGPSLRTGNAGARNHRRFHLPLLLFTCFAALLLTACGAEPASPTLPENIQPTTIAVGVSPEGQRFLILGTLEHGAYVSFNDGVDWTKSEGLPGVPQYDWVEPSILDIAIAPDGRSAFAATAAGFFTSADSGLSWERHTSNNATYEFRQVREVEVSGRFNETPLVLISAVSNVGGGAYVSTNGGTGWTAVSVHSGASDIQLLDDNQLGIAGIDTVTVRPVENLGSIIYWADDHPDPPRSVYRSTFSPAFSKDGLLFFGGVRTDTVHRLDATTGETVDLGMHIGTDLARCDADINWSGYGSSPWCWLEAAYLSPSFATDGIGFIISREGLARTNDHGVTWQLLDGPTPSSEPIASLAFPPAPNQASLVYAVTQRRLLKSTDGGTTWHAYPGLESLPPDPTATPWPTATPGPTPTVTPVPTRRPGYLQP